MASSKNLATDEGAKDEPHKDVSRRSTKTHADQNHGTKTTSQAFSRDVANPQGKHGENHVYHLFSQVKIADGEGFEQSRKSQEKQRFRASAAQNPAHSTPLPNNQARLNELISLWNILSLATQNRIYEIATTEAAGIAPNASEERGGK